MWIFPQFHNFQFKFDFLENESPSEKTFTLLVFAFGPIFSCPLYVYRGSRFQGGGEGPVSGCNFVWQDWLESRTRHNYPSCQQHVEPPCLRKTMPGSPYDFRLAPTNCAWPNEPSPSTMLNHPPVSSSLLQSPRLIRDLPQEDWWDAEIENKSIHQSFEKSVFQCLID